MGMDSRVSDEGFDIRGTAGRSLGLETFGVRVKGFGV